MNAINDAIKRLEIDDATLAVLLGLTSDGAERVTSWRTCGSTIPPQILRKLEAIPETIKYRTNKSGQFKFIDLFAGIGGIRLPFQQLGGECVFTSEWDKYSQITYAANFGDVPMKNGDITKFGAAEIPKHDVLLAGFPCQAFSQAGRREGFYDTRGTMFFEIQRILAYWKPKAFLLENVKQLKGHDGGRTLSTILSTLRGEDIVKIPMEIPMSEESRKALSTKLNYNVDFAVLRARDFGVPQTRERIYIAGFNRDKVSGASDKELVSEMFERVRARNSKTTKLIAALEADHSKTSKYTISDQLWAGHKRRKKKHLANGNGFGYSLFNAESDYCNTISARYYKDGSEILIEQLGQNPRKLTPREAANIQGFPSDFHINSVSDAQAYRQFGNSVAVPVIRAIASEMLPLIHRKIGNRSIESGSNE